MGRLFSDGPRDDFEGPGWRRVLTYPFGLIVAVIGLAGLVCLTFVAYLVGAFTDGETRILFAVYVVLASLLYATALVWGNVEQRRSRRAEAAPELVLEPGEDEFAVSNVGPGPALDAHVAVVVDGERVHDERYPVLRAGASRRVGAFDLGADASVTLRVRAATHLSDVTYRAERTYGGRSLEAIGGE